MANKPPTPQPGKASLSALLYSNSWGQVIPGNLIYFTPTIQDNGNEYPPSFFSGPDQAKGDIPFYSDEYGRVSADDVTPGRYVLAVWTVYDYIIIEDPNNPGIGQDFRRQAGRPDRPWPDGTRLAVIPAEYRHAHYTEKPGRTGAMFISACSAGPFYAYLAPACDLCLVQALALRLAGRA